ncbi:MAG TPA: sarcosine oxidase subunit delta [Sphingobium sp.]|uniref:sarcosine oxidase subunit delta n=1 Tax=Sphingobium sp. TaxID=1912891 RepID=UPI002ED50DA6
MHILCPCCGPRPMAEFTYGGGAVQRPQSDTLDEQEGSDLPDAEWDAFIYERENPSGPHAEMWFHGAACRTWFSLMRDTATHQCLAGAA